MTFTDQLRAAQRATGGRLCVGLDPDPDRLPAPFPGGDAAAVEAFCRAIVDATADVACAFKPNLAFFEALGADGWRAFEAVVRHAHAADRLVIADCKRGDIGNTAAHYAAAFFDRLPCDAVTASPYMGRDSLVPFLQHPGRCCFALVATSNASGPDLQRLVADGEAVWERAARLAADAAEGQPGETGFVVGAQRAGELAGLRARFPDVPFLVPGVGAQGGRAEDVVAAAGAGPLLVNASRSVLYASAGADFAEAARAEAARLRDALPI